MTFTIRPMHIADIKQVMAIERRCFSMPWPSFVYVHEINNNQDAYMAVMEAPDDGETQELPSRFSITRFWTRDDKLQPPLAAYGGIWMDGNEGHISTIASSPDYRRMGLGELMLLALLRRSLALGRRRVVLEVRTSNIIAQNLYKKYGFEIERIHHDYYPDNDEDAQVMALSNMSVAFEKHLEDRWEEMRDRTPVIDHYSGYRYE